MAVTSQLRFDPVLAFGPLNLTTAGNQSGVTSILLASGEYAWIYRSVDGDETPRLEITTPTGPISVDLDLNMVVDMVGDPDIIQLTDGRIVVAWAEGPGSDSGAEDIFRIVIDPVTGTALTAQAYVPSVTTGGTNPQLTALAGGRWVAVYETPMDGVMLQLMDGDIHPPTTAEIDISAAGTTQQDVTVTALVGGGFVVTYTETNATLDVSGQVYDNNGNTVGSAFTVSGTLYDNQSQSAVAALPNGGFVVAMLDAEMGASQIFVRAYDASGVFVFGTLADVSGPGTVVGDPEIDVLPNGYLLVTWTELNGLGNNEVRGRILDQNLDLVSVSVSGATAADDFLLADFLGANAGSTFYDDGSLVTLASGFGTDIGVNQSFLYTLHTGDTDAEFLVGDALIDVAVMGDGNDTVLGGDGADQILGEGGSDTLLGEAGDDLIEGGANADTLIGGAGSDTLSYFLSTAVTVNLATGAASGGDAAGDVFLQFENITGSLFGDVLTGDGAANTLVGDDGVDTLAGGAGADTLIGGLGNDTYALGSEASGIDKVDEFGGDAADLITSTLAAGRSLAFAGFAGIDNLTILAGVRATGNAGANILTGNNANNILDGGAGTDTLKGLLGNDTYVLGNTTDIVQDTGGTDLITSTGNRSLAGFAAIENLTLLGGNINGTGNGGNNVITGTSGANTLHGGIGRGSDTLIGGLGRDKLGGGLGRDFFVFNVTPSAANVDRIVDFSVADDTIRLENAVFRAIRGGVDRTEFLANTTGKAVDGNDFLIYDRSTGELFYDRNGSGTGGPLLVAILSKNLALTHSDFAMI